MTLKIKKHHNFTYILSRLRYYFYENFSHKNYPWLTQKANKWLSKNLNKSMIGLEFGSGKSTLWLANKTKFVHSIETNKDWYVKIKNQQKLYNNSNIKIYFCEQILSDYLNIIDSFEDTYFDYILIDGKFRDYSALKSIEKLKPNGFLIIDNINRYIPSSSKSPSSIRDLSQTSDKWIEFINNTKNYNKYIFTNNVTDTGIFEKK